MIPASLTSLFFHRQRQQKLENEEAKAKLKQAQDMALKKAHSLVVRLASFAGSLISSRNDYRITTTGTPLGLLVGTPTFSLCYATDPKEIKGKLYALEGGSSSALKDFKKVFPPSVLLLLFVMLLLAVNGCRAVLVKTSDLMMCLSIGARKRIYCPHNQATSKHHFSRVFQPS